jgi:two-component system sensor histidine kinase AlgZ
VSIRRARSARLAIARSLTDVSPDAEADRLFLPDFCGIRAVFIVVLIAELLAFVVTLVETTALYRRFEDLALNSLLIQWIALSAAAVLCAARGRLQRLREPVAVTIAYASILLVTWLVSEAAVWVVAQAGGDAPIIKSSRVEFLTRNLAISAIVSAVVLRYFYVQHHWMQRMRSESEARVEALQARIRPHFFFNCMNTIASLTRTRPAAAETAVEDLADLFRASFTEARDLVPIEEELVLCRKYLSIEALRLGARLEVEWRLDDLPAGVRLPALTLQPLLENAIYHGIEPRSAGGVIRIAGGAGEGRVHITIDNPLPDGAAAPTTGNRFAQDNVRQRLAVHYGAEGKLDVERDADSYRVTVTIPGPRGA